MDFLGFFCGPESRRPSLDLGSVDLSDDSYHTYHLKGLPEVKFICYLRLDHPLPLLGSPKEGRGKEEPTIALFIWKVVKILCIKMLNMGVSLIVRRVYLSPEIQGSITSVRCQLSAILSQLRSCWQLIAPMCQLEPPTNA